MIDLLNAKWNAFVKSKFYKQFFLFSFYFLISLVCFTLRPGPPALKSPTNVTVKSNTTGTVTERSTADLEMIGLSVNDTLKLLSTLNGTFDLSSKCQCACVK